MEKKNCWEIKKCGREPGGKNAGEFGVCPAATDIKMDGMNSGRNGGRICWAAAGTLCDEGIYGTYAKSVFSCMGCDVYKKVRKEEGLKGLTIKPG